MKPRWIWLGTGALAAAILVGGTIGVDASIGAIGQNAAGVVGLDDSNAVAPGTIDDGKELLPKAAISLEDALVAAQNGRDGTLGEVDIEYYDGVLVFNVDVGADDVKVDAATGDVLGAVAEGADGSDSDD